MKEHERVEVAQRISVVTIIANIVLSILKVGVGFFANSSAMVADGIHSVTDVFTTVLAFAGIKMASKKADDDHPYGHERLEPVMGKLLAIVLMLTGLGIAYSAFKIIQSGEIETPGRLAIYAALISIVTKEWMYHYTIRGARQIGSSALKADAWHHRTDSLSSVGALIGIVGARYGYAILDPLASVAISVLVIKVAVEVYLQSVRELVDTSADPETVETIRQIITSVEGVICIDLMRSRLHGNLIYVDVEIGVDADLSLRCAHTIAENVHNRLEKELPKVKHCMVHVNPIEKEI